MFDESKNWKGRLLSFILYMAVGFGAAFLYRYFKS